MLNHSDANYTWFRNSLPEFLTSHRGEHALLHEQGVVGFYPTSFEAIVAGMKKFGEGHFSVEPVDDSIEDLGFFSHVSAALLA